MTLGKGYDMGCRTAAAVFNDLTAAGMGADQATKIAAGASLVGEDAHAFVQTHVNIVGEIERSVQYALLAKTLRTETENARHIATDETTSSKEFNARGREIHDHKDPGTYRLTSAEWNTLHPAMVEFLTDLKYHGAYYAYDRVAKINEALKAHMGDHLGQFRAIAKLFSSEDAAAGQLSYMDEYASKINQGDRSNETFYGQSAESLAGATSRRNRIRLAYLNQIIAALAAGKSVEMGTSAGGSTVPAGTSNTAENARPPAPKPKPSAATSADGEERAGASRQSAGRPRPHPAPRPHEQTQGGAGGTLTLSGARWVSIANQNGWSNSQKLDDLEPAFGAKVQTFVDDLKASKAHVEITSTFRHVKRAALMHFAWHIAHGTKSVDVANADCQSKGIPIEWDHGDAKATRAAAQAMVSAFSLAHEPSLSSHHLTGEAVDMKITEVPSAITVDNNAVPTDKKGTGKLDEDKVDHIGKKLGVVWFGASDYVHWSKTGR